MKSGFDNIVLNTILMDSNLDDVVLLAKQANDWGINISFSAYSSFKANNDSEFIQESHLEKLHTTLDTLRDLKAKNHNIMSSDYFFDNVPTYFKEEEEVKK